MPRGKKSQTLSQLMEQIESYKSLTAICGYLEKGAALAKRIKALDLGDPDRIPVSQLATLDKRLKEADQLKKEVAAFMFKTQAGAPKRRGRKPAAAAAAAAPAKAVAKVKKAKAPVVRTGKRLPKAKAEETKKAIIAVLTESKTPVAKSDLVKKIVKECGIAAKQARNLMIGMKREGAIQGAGFGKYTVKQA